MSPGTRRLIRTVQLDHPLKYHHAIHKKRMVEALQDSEPVGYGLIIEFDGEVVTLVDPDTGVEAFYTVYACQFFADID